MKFSTYYFHMKTRILAGFQNCISVPLSATNCSNFVSAAFVDMVLSCSFKVKRFHDNDFLIPWQIIPKLAVSSLATCCPNLMTITFLDQEI